MELSVGALAFGGLPGDMSKEVSVAAPFPGLSTTSDCEKCVINDPDRAHSRVRLATDRNIVWEKWRGTGN